MNWTSAPMPRADVPRAALVEPEAEPATSAAAVCAFQRLFRGPLARQVEYSFGNTPERVTTMIPLDGEPVLADVVAMAVALPFAGAWSWAVPRLAKTVRPD